MKCPEPPIAVSDLLCWTCGGKNHSSRDCPERVKKPVKLMGDEGQGEPRRLAMVVEADGYSKPKHSCRPMPRPATLNEFVHNNPFEKFPQNEQTVKRKEEAWRAVAENESDEYGADILEIAPIPGVNGCGFTQEDTDELCAYVRERVAEAHLELCLVDPAGKMRRCLSMDDLNGIELLYPSCGGVKGACERGRVNGGV